MRGLAGDAEEAFNTHSSVSAGQAPAATTNGGGGTGPGPAGSGRAAGGGGDQRAAVGDVLLPRPPGTRAPGPRRAGRVCMAKGRRRRCERVLCCSGGGGGGRV